MTTNPIVDSAYTQVKAHWAADVCTQVVVHRFLNGTFIVSIDGRVHSSSLHMSADEAHAIGGSLMRMANDAREAADNALAAMQPVDLMPVTVIPVGEPQRMGDAIIYCEVAADVTDFPNIPVIVPFEGQDTGEDILAVEGPH